MTALAAASAPSNKNQQEPTTVSFKQYLALVTGYTIGFMIWSWFVAGIWVVLNPDYINSPKAYHFHPFLDAIDWAAAISIAAVLAMSITHLVFIYLKYGPSHGYGRSDSW